MENKKNYKRKLSGTVISNKCNKTITVSVSKKIKHARYDKYVSISKKYYAHDEINSAKIGDVVTIIESKPISKLKRWELYRTEK
ncbi:MAG: 30S ribosomal protein S17 [Oligoflexia bacterium]|nr:30S ribosomal protein S17 [Oligoflexia bacterium]